MSYPIITLKPGKEKSLGNFHPWVFSGAIARQDEHLQAGDVVEVHDSKGGFLALGHFHKGTITVRAFAFESRAIDREFWKQKLLRAKVVRADVGLPNAGTDVYRLVHGEGDGMPGMIIDIYGNLAVVQAHSVGMYRIRNEIAALLMEIFGSALASVYDKSADSMAKHGYESETNASLVGEAGMQEVMEYGNKFLVDCRNGQKTGFFIDQRENRKLLGAMAHGKSVLNAFSYSGGFSVYALKEGATLVHSVDSSQTALDLATQNAEINGVSDRHTSINADVFEYFKTSDQQYDVVVVDPPAFAKHLSAVRRAAIGYKSLNIAALRSMKSGSVLFTFSCSQAIDKTLFRQIVFSAASTTKRTVRILHQLTQPADHPINIYHPEGEYLKGLVLHVE